VAQAGVLAAMEPVDPIQALNDADPVAAQTQQAGEITRPASDEDRVKVCSGCVIADLNTPGN
jgi:hypothetical protein